jgi:hypothetical protein
MKYPKIILRIVRSTYNEYIKYIKKKLKQQKSKTPMHKRKTSLVFQV